MAKKIIILEGSPRLKGNTSVLTEAFTKGAQEAGAEVRCYDLQSMNIHNCLGCMAGGKDPQHPCVLRDDMDKIYPAFMEADVVVLASPLYYWSFSGQLFIALNRLYAVSELASGYELPHKQCVMLVTAELNTKENFQPIRDYYAALVKNLHWTDAGSVLAGGVLDIGDIHGKPELEHAYALGKKIGA